MDKSKMLNTIVLVLLVVLTITVLVIGFFTYKIVFPTEEQAIVIKYEELKPTDIITIKLDDNITSNLLMEGNEKEYFAIVEMSYEIANIEEYEEEVTELISVLQNSEVIVRRIATNEIRKRTYDEMLSNQIYDELAEDILKQLQEEFSTELICNVMIHKVIAG